MDMGTGRLLDHRYRLGPLVGRGGMAAVHAATDIWLRRAVAVKLFSQPADEISMARLEAEAKLLAGLSHPGLLRVFDVSTSAGQPYLVMQLVSGCTLRTLINRGPMEPAGVARIGARLAETLRYVHSRNVVHRDIKPSNVLLGGDGCYLADFGIAKAIGAARLTRSGHCVGTAAYLAPEQVTGVPAGPAADIYALGLVLLECLTGRPEYDGTETEAALARLSRAPHVPDRVPPALRQALLAMTARDPRDRPDAAACVESLGVEVVSAAPAVIQPTKRLETRRRLVPAALGLVLAAGAATATLFVTGAAEPGAAVLPARQHPVPVVAPPQPAVANAGQPAARPKAPQRGKGGFDRKQENEKGKGGHSGHE